MTEPVTTVKKTLKLRERLKKRKPKFVRQESWRYKRLKENWRKPRGLDNKMRRKIKGWPPTVNAGYRGPKATRGLHPSGYKEVLVHNVEELEQIDPKTQAVRIAHAVGKRERARILVECKKKKITVLNFKEVEVKKEKELVEAKEEEVEEKEKEKGEEKKEKRKGRRRKQ